MHWFDELNYLGVTSVKVVIFLDLIDLLTFLIIRSMRSAA
jgi:hypothetical protein